MADKSCIYSTFIEKGLTMSVRALKRQSKQKARAFSKSATKLTDMTSGILQYILPAVNIETILRECGYSWRDSELMPATMIYSLVNRALKGNSSIQKVVADLFNADKLDKLISPSAWDQARTRIPHEALKRLNHLVATTETNQGSCGWLGRKAVFVDGSTVSMPDDKRLVAEFGRTGSKHGKSRFPVARLVVAQDARTSQFIDYALANYHTSEAALFREIMPKLPAGAIWVADKYYGSSVLYHLSSQAGLDYLTPLHQKRDGKQLTAAGKKIGKDEWIVELSVSAPVKRKYPELNLPAQIKTRLLRVKYKNYRGENKTLWLCTSLLDHVKYPRGEIAELYRVRWGIETHIGFLKTELNMAVLKSKTPDNIRKEFAALILAHNIIWRLINESGELNENHKPAQSFCGAISVVLAYAGRQFMASPETTRQEFWSAMLRQIARRKVKKRPNRHEPRLRKRDPQSFGIMRIPREEARKIA